MEKKKVLIILTTNTPEFFQTDPDICKAVKSLGGDVEISYFVDDFFDRYEDSYAAVKRIETEGSEWVENDPALLEAIRGKEVLIVQAAAINREVIDAADSCRLIVYLRSGLEAVNVEHCKEKGILVKNCPGRHANSVADLTMGLIISENKGIQRYNLKATHGKFVEYDFENDPGCKPLCMQTAGLIGFGMIAQAVAGRLKACGTTVYAYDPFAPQEVFDKLHVKRFNDMEKMLPKCDIVSIHVRLSDETEGMIGREQFALMKQSAIFINTARAGLVREDELIEALEQGRIRGAGVDVYAQEPVPEDHAFITLPNVTATPHMGGIYYGVVQWTFSIAVNIVREYFDGKSV